MIVIKINIIKENIFWDAESIPRSFMNPGYEQKTLVSYFYEKT